jgi:hypothetical protein
MYLFAAETVSLFDALLAFAVVGVGLGIIVLGLYLSERWRERRDA